MDKSNSMAVWTCVLIQQALGYAWYSDKLFKGAWAAALGRTAAEMHPNAIALILSITASLLMTRFLGWMFFKLEIHDAFRGALMGFLAWIAFIGPVLASHYLAMGLADKVVFLDAGKELLAAVLTGAILAAWPLKKTGSDGPP